MPRANRYFLPGHVWHITHRCHQQAFLLKFAKDRQCWLRWLYEARQRYGLCVLNYMVTSNHIHLLVKDTGDDAIPRSMQLVAGRTAQFYNQRKRRKGAFWEDRYHATAVQGDHHLSQCLVYIDMNMVRAGRVSHPKAWPHCGYHELQSRQRRYRIVDVDALLSLFQFPDFPALQQAHQAWLDSELAKSRSRWQREPAWTESVAVGNQDYVAQVKSELGYRAKGRRLIEFETTYQLKEPDVLYLSNHP